MEMRLNKRGADIPTVIFIIVTIFGIAVLFFFTQNLSNEIFDAFGNSLEKMPQYDNDTLAVSAIREIEATNLVVWDWGFLAIAISLLFVLGFSAFATSISPIFYWVYGILGMLVFTIGIMMSNIWQEMADSPAFAETITYFPITNAILGSYYPTLILGALILGMVLLFGKGEGQQ